MPLKKQNNKQMADNNPNAVARNNNYYYCLSDDLYHNHTCLPCLTIITNVISPLCDSKVN